MLNKVSLGFLVSNVTHDVATGKTQTTDLLSILKHTRLAPHIKWISVNRLLDVVLGQLNARRLRRIPNFPHRRPDEIINWGLCDPHARCIHASNSRNRV
jgi:hypothetical protein